jgi:hypothetical protein
VLVIVNEDGVSPLDLLLGRLLHRGKENWECQGLDVKSSAVITEECRDSGERLQVIFIHNCTPCMSSCLAALGHRVLDPSQTIGDPAWDQDATSHTSAELSTVTYLIGSMCKISELET